MPTKSILSPLGKLYGKIADLRNSLYDRGILRSHSLGAKTISIGNITTGGTGKTPLVATVSEILAENGERVCILTRGYGRDNPRVRVLVSDGERVLADAKTGGDEPVELAHKLMGKALVVADADRVAAARWAKAKFGVTAFVLDDGFQHRRAKRDLDIVCIDATRPCGNGRVLPAGTLREPLQNLRRADAVVITRANLVEDISDLKSRISKLASDAKVFVSENRIGRVTVLEAIHAETQRTPSEEIKISEILDQKSLAFCALGNPEAFFLQLKNEGFLITATKAFSDHYYYSQSEVDELEEKARVAGAECFITTAKDAVKLKDLKFEIPCIVAEAETVVENEPEFRELIVSV